MANGLRCLLPVNPDRNGDINSTSNTFFVTFTFIVQVHLKSTTTDYEQRIFSSVRVAPTMGFIRLMMICNLHTIFCPTIVIIRMSDTLSYLRSTPIYAGRVKRMRTSLISFILHFACSGILLIQHKFKLKIGFTIIQFLDNKLTAATCRAPLKGTFKTYILSPDGVPW